MAQNRRNNNFFHRIYKLLRFHTGKIFKFLAGITAGIYYSLPVQLLINHLRNNKSLVILWGILLLVISQNLFKSLGGSYLFLEPEYLNNFGFLSMLILGVSFGVFTLAFQLTSYILDGYRFFFLGDEEKPFLKFCLNNSIIPLIFWITYSICFFEFQVSNPEISVGQVLWYLFGCWLGGGLLILIASGYYSLTNIDIVRVWGGKVVREISGVSIIRQELRKALGVNIRVDYFLPNLWNIKAVPTKLRADLNTLVKVLKQNHSNAIVSEAIILMILIILGIFQDVPEIRVPAGASFMLLFSFVIMLIGAIAYWTRYLGMFFIFILIGLGLTLNSWQPFVGRNSAFGINYCVPPAKYNGNELKKLASEENYIKDYNATIQILQNWKKRWQDKYGYSSKPKMVMLCVTGGGNRSACWTVHCLQKADQALKGKLRDNLTLINGASGGMLGAAYYRELLYLQKENPKINPYDTIHVDRISSDLLNPIIFNLTTNLVWPSQSFEESGCRYQKDRGYVFENQMVDNTKVFADRKLQDYYLPEQKAEIPLLLLAPTIVNDGRQLLITPQKVSYLTKPLTFNPSYTNEVSCVEYSRMFQNHNSGSLKFTSALRMNATFPTILPFVELPTEPEIAVLDAGVVDNFGINMTVKFLYVFRKWIEQNTDGVVILQMRDSEREAPIPPAERKSILGRLAATLGGTYLSFAESKDFANDATLEYAHTWFHGKLDVIDFQYIPRHTFEEASLSFHITRREKKDILNAFQNPMNQKSLQTLKRLLN